MKRRLRYVSVHEFKDHVRRGDAVGVERLLEVCPGLIHTIPDSSPCSTWLHEAAQYGTPGLVQLFLERGADINGVDGKNRTALQVAIVEHQRANVQLFLDLGANTESMGSYTTALHMAVLQEALAEPHMTQMVIGCGRSNLEALCDGQTPLYVAAYNGNLRMVQMLLEAGADPYFTCNGKTPLRAAQYKRHKDVAEWLKGWMTADRAQRAVERVSQVDDSNTVRPL